MGPSRATTLHGFRLCAGAAENDPRCLIWPAIYTITLRWLARATRPPPPSAGVVGTKTGV